MDTKTLILTLRAWRDETITAHSDRIQHRWTVCGHRCGGAVTCPGEYAHDRADYYTRDKISPAPHCPDVRYAGRYIGSVALDGGSQGDFSPAAWMSESTLTQSYALAYAWAADLAREVGASLPNVPAPPMSRWDVHRKVYGMSMNSDPSI